MSDPPAKTWGFSSLPAELRLQILANTHLGPPSTGGYNPRFSTLYIRDGIVYPHHQLPYAIWDQPTPGPECDSPITHGTTHPQCQCRIIPTQLFTVSRQTSIEALEVFYTNLHLDIDHSPPVTFLHSLSPQTIHRLRRLTFTMTPAQVEGWCDGAVASGYGAGMLETQVAIPSWGGGPVKPPGDDALYRRAWREVVALLAAHADLPRLALTVDMGGCTWMYVEDTLMWDDPPGEILPIFRFIYDFYMDVATALCGLRGGLRALGLEMTAFAQMRPWLEREVLGRESPQPTFETAWARRRWEELWRCPRFYQVVPEWHDGERRLEGSNYRPE